MEKITFYQYQDKVLEIYSKVTKYFEYIGISWWVHSGTLLGIKRHNNDMIPWDDDIDLMVKTTDWKNNYESTKVFADSENLFYFDLWLKEYDIPTYTKFAQFLSKDTYEVEIENNRSVILRPFVDVFFACPSDTFSPKEWIKYSKKWPLNWIYSSRFDKYPFAENNKFVKNLINLLTYPIGFILNESKNNNYLYSPYNNNKEGKLYRRVDYWSYRNIEYDLSDGLVNGNIRGFKAIYNKNWKKELEESYGVNWESEIKGKRHFENKTRNKFNKYRDAVMEEINNV